MTTPPTAADIATLCIVSGCVGAAIVIALLLAWIWAAERVLRRRREIYRRASRTVLRRI